MVRQEQDSETRNFTFKIINVQRKVMQAMEEVDSFYGSFEDRQYKLLNKKLLDSQLELDDIHLINNQNLKFVKRQMTICIQRCSNILDAKAEMGSQSEVKTDQDGELRIERQNSDQAGRQTEEGNAMHVDANSHSDVNNMEVESNRATNL